MNWGYRIIILYTLFVGGILYLVYRCTKEDVDLVSADYYAQELKFQDHINRMNNINESGYKLQIAFNNTTNSIDIVYPSAADSHPVKGELVFFRPDNSKLDFKVAIKPESGKQSIPTPKLAKGLWRIQASWEVGTTPLYQEEKIFIQ